MSKPNHPDFSRNQQYIPRTVYGGFPTVIHSGRQGKHYTTHSNFSKEKSEVTIDLDTLQYLVDTLAGSGIFYPPNKERINFGVIIGYHVNRLTGQRYETTYGTVDYSRTGCHVEPASPQEVQNV